MHRSTHKIGAPENRAADGFEGIAYASTSARPCESRTRAFNALLTRVSLMGLGVMYGR